MLSKFYEIAIKSKNSIYIPLLPTETLEVLCPWFGAEWAMEEVTAMLGFVDVPGYGGGGGRFT